MSAPKYLSGDSLTLTAPTGGVTYGVPAIIEDMFVLPSNTADAGVDVVCDLNGVWAEIACVTGVSWSAAQKLYWNGSALTNDPAGNRFVGYAAADKASADTECLLLVDPRANDAGDPGVGQHGFAFLTYDFDVDGGAIGSFYGDALPDNALGLRSGYEVLTTLTSSTDAATGALGIETDDVAGIKAAEAISAGGNPWDAGVFDGIQDGTAANVATKTTAAGRRLQFDVAVEALTAGKLVAWLEYVVTG